VHAECLLGRETVKKREALHEMCQNWLCSIDSEYCQL